MQLCSSAAVQLSCAVVQLSLDPGQMGTVSRFYMDPMTGIVSVAVQDAQQDALNVCGSVSGGLRASLPCVTGLVL